MTATAPASRRRLTVTATSAPKLARGVKLRHDASRDRWVLLVPERVLAPDAIAIAILKLCDGINTVEDITETLAEVYSAPAEEIMADIIEMLQELADSGFVIAGEGKP